MGELIGFILLRPYPGCTKRVGEFEKYTTGEFLNYPDIWKPVYAPPADAHCALSAQNVVRVDGRNFEVKVEVRPLRTEPRYQCQSHDLKH